MRNPWIVLVLLFCLLSGQALGEQVCSVKSGDRIRICKGYRVKLWGIDAPENKQPYGHAARRYLETLVKGKAVRMDCLHWQDLNQVCRVFVDEQDIANAMVKAGYAFDDQHISHGLYSKSEREAIREQRGIWKGPSVYNTPPWVYRR